VVVDYWLDPAVAVGGLEPVEQLVQMALGCFLVAVVVLQHPFAEDRVVQFPLLLLDQFSSAISMDSEENLQTRCRNHHLAGSG
jgi:hypothetical protein